MTTPALYDIAVEVFSAKFNSTTNKIDITWHEPKDITNGNVPKPKYYALAYRDGSFIPATSFEDNLNKYSLTYINAGLNIPTSQTVATFSWTPVGTGTQWSFGIWPIFEIPATNFLPSYTVEGRIKLLTYTKNIDLGAIPVAGASDIEFNSDASELYIHNGLKQAVEDNAVISKLNSSLELNHVTTSTQTLTMIVNRNQQIAFKDDVLYFTQYDNDLNKINVLTKEITKVNNIYNSGQSGISTFKDLFVADSKMYFTVCYDKVNSTTQGLFELDYNMTSGSSVKTFPTGWSYSVIETVNSNLYVKKYLTTNTDNLNVGQLFTMNGELGNSVIIEVVDNVSFSFISRNSSISALANTITLYNIKMVAGGFSYNSGVTVNPFDTTRWYNKDFGTTASSKGFYFNNHYYYNRINFDNNNEFVKINLNTKELTVIGTNTTYTYQDIKYNINNGYAYAVSRGNNGIITRKDITDNSTTFIAGGFGSTDGDIDGIGSNARFRSIIGIAISNNANYGFVITTGIGTTLTALENKIRIIDFTNNEVTTLPIIAEQPVEEKKDSDGNGDITDNGSGDIGLGNGDYRADVPPYNSVNPDPVIVRNPEDEIIGTIPMPPGLPPNPVVTFRKNWDRLYVLVNGIIIWSYRLSPFELYNYNSKGYRGWYQRGTRTEITTPEDAIKPPVFDGFYYVFDGTVVEPMASPDILFTYGKNYVGQALAILDNGDVIIDRVIDNDDVANATYLVRGGRKYKTFHNQYGPSPLLPRYVIDAIAEAGYYQYLKEVEVPE